MLKGPQETVRPRGDEFLASGRSCAAVRKTSREWQTSAASWPDMDVGEFWTLLDGTRTSVDQLEALGVLLEDLDAKTLEEFRACYRGLMGYANDGRLWDAGRIAWLGMDRATFFGLRAWLVAQGRETYQDVLANPDRLAGLEPRDSPELAWVIAGDSEGLTPSRFLTPSLGDDEEGLRKLYPKLWRRHRTHPMHSVDPIDKVTQWVYDRLRSDGHVGLGAFVSQARGVGCARRLVGGTELIVASLSGPAGRLLEAPLKYACRLLSAEAARYEVDLQWRPLAPFILEKRKLHERTLDRLDHRAVGELMHELAPFVPKDNGAVVIATPELNCSPTTWRSNRFNRDRLEFCLLPWKSTPEVVARHLLLSFGAPALSPGRGPGSDMRAWILGRVAPLAGAALGRGFLADSVMRFDSRKPAVVDPLTALAIGWTETLAGFEVPLFQLQRAG